MKCSVTNVLRQEILERKKLHKKKNLLLGSIKAASGELDACANF